MELSQVESSAAARGLRLRGAFHVEAADDVPPAPDGRPCRSLVLLGNAGPEMFRRFSAERRSVEDKLDDWSRAVITPVAEALGGWPLFPFERPHLPFIRWAQRAEPCRPSPIGILIHPEYGLWHGYRGAIAFAEPLGLPARSDPPSPCDRCTDRPCLTTCPVNAFGADGYDVPACARHLARPEGGDCMSRGCRARRACPVGVEFRYEPAQAAFHMAHFLRVHG